LAIATEADIVVMGTVGLGGIQDAPVDNAAETLFETGRLLRARDSASWLCLTDYSGSVILQTLYFTLALFLLLNLFAGMWRILHGPTSADRMLTAQLFGTTSVAVLLLLAQATEKDALRDVALVFALLAAVTAVAFVRRAWPGQGEKK